jgi:hypothetical protein
MHMKKSRMLMLGALLVFAGDFEGQVFCEEVNSTTNFVVRASLTPDVIYPYEPVWMTYEIKNISDKDQKTQSRRPPTFAVKQGEKGEWETYMSFGPHPPPLIQPITKVMKPGESEMGSILIDVHYGGRPVFSMLGEYFVKVGTWVGESAPQRIAVKEPPKEEEEPLRYVAENRLDRWFSEDTVRINRYNGQDATSKLAEFVRRFPTSRYAQRVKLAQLWVKKHDAGDDPKALQSVQGELEALAPHLPEPMKAMCWYSAEEAASKRGDVGRAEINFQNAIAAGTNTFIAERATNALQQAAVVARYHSRHLKVKPEPLSPVAGNTRGEVEAVIQKMFAAFAGGTACDCERWMAEDFRRNQVSNREQTIQTMEKDLRKLNGKKLGIDVNVLTVETDGTNVIATARLEYTGENLAEEEVARFTLKLGAQGWLLTHWDRIGSKRPIGNPPAPNR